MAALYDVPRNLAGSNLAKGAWPQPVRSVAVDGSPVGAAALHELHVSICMRFKYAPVVRSNLQWIVCQPEHLLVCGGELDPFHAGPVCGARRLRIVHPGDAVHKAQSEPIAKCQGKTFGVEGTRRTLLLEYVQTDV